MGSSWRIWGYFFEVVVLDSSTFCAMRLANRNGLNESKRADLATAEPGPT
jgi:hypothetical protein